VNVLAIIFILVAAVFLFRSPKPWAPLPLLLGASYLTYGQELLMGPFHFTVIRILLAVGAIRVMLKHERISGGLKQLDWMMIYWGVWAIISSLFHNDIAATLVSHLGLVYDSLGIYFLMRVFVEDMDGVLGLCKIVVILLIPVALEMVAEHLRGTNAFSIFGGISEVCEVRKGKIRAQGPFGHSILAGTVGGVCMPMAVMLWKENRKLAIIGIIVTGIIVMASSSSGPIMTTVFVLIGVCCWTVRQHMQLVRWSILLGLFALNLVMKVPVYYLISKIDLTGSSTGWHRSALIGAAIEHVDEWWLGGTDYTRHWMPTGVQWNQNHTDITNHYIKMGVLGGLPMMILFILVLASAFSTVGKALSLQKNEPVWRQFQIWTLGVILFAHVATFFSISYFDQSVVFLYLLLAAIACLNIDAKSSTIKH